MDRVLLVFDDLQYAGHLEMTLRKVGFDTETITNEYNLSDKLLSFNPDFIIVKGNSSRVSGLQVGKKLKESVKYSGRVILIFPEDLKPKPDELIKLRMDLLLFEPLSALRLVAHLMTLTNGDQDTIMDKLLRIAHTDTQFRQSEQQIIKTTGASIDVEIQFITSRMKGKATTTETLDENSIQSFYDPNFIDGKAKTSPDLDTSYKPVIDPAFIKSVNEEVLSAKDELPLRIETYNRVINTVDQDLKIGLSKRHTKKSARESESITLPDEKTDRDEARKKFVTALWKKEKGE